MPVSGPGSKAANRHTAPTSLRCLKVSPDGSHLAIAPTSVTECAACKSILTAAAWPLVSAWQAGLCPQLAG
eukprot:1157836-Pelagomonas_calceolata.AAC.10